MQIFIKSSMTSEVIQGHKSWTFWSKIRLFFSLCYWLIEKQMPLNILKEKVWLVKRRHFPCFDLNLRSFVLVFLYLAVYWFSMNLKLSWRKSIIIILYHYSSNKLSIIVIYFYNYPSISVLSIVWMESFSLYIQIFSKSYGALKKPMWLVLSNLIFFLNLGYFFPLL